mmetsp:Transcript_3405/g.8327  ORF Transcript_3405/g.8327 Transcript_3405/m.8327 type:complete len:240 (-) Transcript_3405:230-949(-)
MAWLPVDQFNGSRYRVVYTWLPGTGSNNSRCNLKVRLASDRGSALTTSESSVGGEGYLTASLTDSLLGRGSESGIRGESARIFNEPDDDGGVEAPSSLEVCELRDGNSADSPTNICGVAPSISATAKAATAPRLSPTTLSCVFGSPRTPRTARTHAARRSHCPRNPNANTTPASPCSWPQPSTPILNLKGFDRRPFSRAVRAACAADAASLPTSMPRSNSWNNPICVVLRSTTFAVPSK